MGAHQITIPLLNGQNFNFTPKKQKGERGLSLQHIAAILICIGAKYKGSTPRFSQADVIRIVWRLLHKREPHQIQGGGKDVTITANPKPHLINIVLR